MKGVIFNAVQDAVEQNLGADAWDDTLARAALDGAYTSLGNYDDAELVAIIGALPDETGGDIPDRLRWVGMHAVPYLVSAFPQFFEGVTLREFLPALNHMIPPEVRKLYPGATPPDFGITDVDEQTVDLRYVSARQMSVLAEGFILGVAAQLGETVTVEQPASGHVSPNDCVIRVSGLR